MEQVDGSGRGSAVTQGWHVQAATLVWRLYDVFPYTDPLSTVKPSAPTFNLIELVEVE